MLRITSRNLAALFTRFPVFCLLFLLATALPSAWLASRLTLLSDFKSLLPSDKPSVIEMDRLIDRLGGVGNLTVAVESDDYKATERFIEDLVARLKQLPPGYIRYLEYNVTDVRNFFSDNRYLYMDLEDLRTVHDRLARKIRYEKLRKNPFYIALDEDREQFDLGDLKKKYEKRASEYDYKDGYFFSDDLKLAAVVIRPYGSSTSIDFTRDLVGKVEGIIRDLNPKTYSPSMKTGFAGKYQETLDEYAQVRRDMMGTLGLCLFLVAVSLWVYFLRIRSIWLLTIPLGTGVLWTFAATALRIGHLNTQTVFLGSIIVGNGVNTGIILLARYLEERRAGHPVEASMGTAIHTTWLGTLAAALTTSASFAVLAFSSIKGFSEFGFIGGAGMAICWFATYVTLPPLLALSERISPFVKGEIQTSKPWEFLLRPVGNLVAFSPRLVMGFSLFLAAGGLALFLRFVPNSMEYDFSKLRNRPEETHGGKNLNDRVDDIFKQDLAAVVILLDQENQAEHVCDVIMQRETGYPEPQKTIDSCKTLQSYLPDRQPEKLAVIQKIRRLLEDHSLNFVKPEYRRELDEFRKRTDLKQISLADLPELVKRNFQELNNRIGRVVYVFPRRTANLSNGKSLIHFADMLADVRLPDGSVVRMSGEAAIFADLLRAVKRDGPLATILSFLAVSLIIIVGFRRIHAIAYIIGGLVVGVMLMFGLQAILQIKLNFFNFIALPVTFGIGVDYGVNLLQRYRFEGRGSVRRVIVSVGGAIVLCSVTTTIGYATLVTARNQALASFGWLGLIGELACLFSAVVVMPAVLHSFDRRSDGVNPAKKP